MPEKKKVKWYWEKDDEGKREMEIKAGKQKQNVFTQIVKPFGFHIDIRMPRMQTSMPINMSETDNELIIHAQLPGFKKDEIKLAVTRTMFELSAQKKHETLEQGKNFFRKEVGQRAFHQTFTLPAAVDADNVRARLDEGILTVTMPKLETAKKKKKVEVE